MKIRKELWFGFSLMGIILLSIVVMMPWGNVTNGHLGLLMLSLIVVAIMLGFPTAFTLMGLGMSFAYIAYRTVNPDLAVDQVLNLMVQRGAYGVMSNDVLIAVPLFVFMGYLVERAALIDRLFKSLHLATARVPGSLAVATIVTCAIFATATGIIGAVVTLMGLLAMPAMLKAGYNVKVSAGTITAGGCLGILIPPSVLLILYGATAGVSVVQLYAGAFFPGLMLAGLYLLYIIILAKLKPELMPPLPESERTVRLPTFAQTLAAHGRNALTGLAGAISGRRGVPSRTALAQFVISLLPALVIAGVLLMTYRLATAPVVVDTTGLVESGSEVVETPSDQGGLAEPPVEETKPEQLGGATEAKPESGPQQLGEAAPPAEEAAKPAPAKPAAQAPAAPAKAAAQPERLPVPTWLWVTIGIFVVILLVLYGFWNWQRFEVFKMLLSSFFPLALLILAVLGSIVFGFATPTEAAAVGAFGGFILAAVYRLIENWRAASKEGNPTSSIWRTVKELGVILRDSSF
ncbi:MAG TPA: TRAP transporter large permease subunit, partial [Burkholderiales bacterium]|nr:TRAP transporter large permease subunit [Burkholderiales bacterium]